MTREWKPGDVAMVSSINGEAAVGFAVGVGEVSGWRTEDGSLWGPRYTHLARPLVVIDPEDREQVERLTRTAFPHGMFPAAADEMQRGLREFANPTPPKPDEPQGLGAVVEDAFGHVLIRLSTTWFNINEDQHCTWDHIAAVRVLSEGVTS